MNKIILGVILGFLTPVVIVVVWLSLGNKNTENGIPALSQPSQSGIVKNEAKPKPVGEKWFKIQGKMLVPEPLQKEFSSRRLNVRALFNYDGASFSEGLTSDVDDFTLQSNGNFEFHVFDKIDVFEKIMKAPNGGAVQMLFCDNSVNYCRPEIKPLFRGSYFLKIDPQELAQKTITVSKLVISEFFEDVKNCVSNEIDFRADIQATEPFRKKFFKETSNFFLLVFPGGLAPLKSGQVPLKVLPLEFKGNVASLVVQNLSQNQRIKHYLSYIAACNPNESRSDCEKRMAGINFFSGIKGRSYQLDNDRAVKIFPEGNRGLNCGSEKPYRLYAPWFDRDKDQRILTSTGGLPAYAVDGLYY